MTTAPRVEMGRRYYVPATRAVPTAPSAPPRRRLPVLSIADETRAGLRRAIEKVRDEDPALPDPIAPTTRGEWSGGRPRTVTVSCARLSKRAVDLGRAVYPEAEHAFGEGRPRTYEGCEAVGLGTRVPCPFVSCKHHLYLDVDDRRGSYKISAPHREVVDLPHTCALAEGDLTLDEIAARMGLTRERVRQIESRAIAKVLRAPGIDRAKIVEALAALDEGMG